MSLTKMTAEPMSTKIAAMRLKIALGMARTPLAVLMDQWSMQRVPSRKRRVVRHLPTLRPIYYSRVDANPAIPGTNDALVKVHLDGDDYFSGIRRVTDSGTTVWSLGAPAFGPNDTWVSAEIEGDVLILNSWSGYSVAVNLATGALGSPAFTK